MRSRAGEGEERENLNFRSSEDVDGDLSTHRSALNFGVRLEVRGSDMASGPS